MSQVRFLPNAEGNDTGLSLLQVKATVVVPFVLQVSTGAVDTMRRRPEFGLDGETWQECRKILDGRTQVNRLHSENRSRLGPRREEGDATPYQRHGPSQRIDREHTSHRHLSKSDAKRYPLRILYLIAGLACIVLGLIGILIPGLPTTPFILLASWCFSRSSRRLENALLRSRLFGAFIRDWRQHRAIRRPVRYLAVGLVVTMMLTTCILSDFSYALKASIAVLACIGLLVIVRIPVLPIDAPDESTRIDDVTSSISNESL